MTVNYTVQATVIDLRSDTPTSADSFLVDTNVWFWMTYSNASISSVRYQTRDYPRYIANCLRNKSTLLRCNLSFPELAHNIEQSELTIYNQTSPQPLKPKEFRHNAPVHRTQVVAEVSAAWGQVKTMARPLEGFTIDESNTDRAVMQLQTHALDGYDTFMLHALNEHGETYVITDDGDYCTVSGITMFTANRVVIAAARSQGKLLVR